MIEYLLRSALRVGFPWCIASAVFFAGSRGEAQQFRYGGYSGGSYGTGFYGMGIYGGGGPDPNYYAPAPGTYPDVYSTYTWQTNPYAVGYDLLAGYRPIYGGARQPTGHEVIWTSQNSYVYRPTYAPNTRSSRVAWGGGPLVIDFPGTDRAKYYSSSGRVWEAQSRETRLRETQPGMFTANDVAPPIPLDNPARQLYAPARQAVVPSPARCGPREF